jgi:2-polyprenyl-3-methyl-5-hydroxy-6-metoxy-1,4-benzoquinol methylase
VNFLAKDWLGAVPGLAGKLDAGVRVADVGCGCGQSSVVMARAFPKSKFVAIDYDRGSIERAKKLAAAKEAGNLDPATHHIRPSRVGRADSRPRAFDTEGSSPASLSPWWKHA